MLIDRRLDTSFSGAQKIAARKSIWLKLYVEARRSNDRLKGFYRRKHFESKEP